MAWVMTSESLKCLLTQDEKLKLGDKVAQTVQRMRSKEDTLQEVSSQIKAEIKACQAEMTADTTKLANGYDYRVVDCRVYYHSPHKGLEACCSARHIRRGSHRKDGRLGASAEPIRGSGPDRVHARAAAGR